MLGSRNDSRHACPPTEQDRAGVPRPHGATTHSDRKATPNFASSNNSNSKDIQHHHKKTSSTRTLRTNSVPPSALTTTTKRTSSLCTTVGHGTTVRPRKVPTTSGISHEDVKGKDTKTGNGTAFITHT